MASVTYDEMEFSQKLKDLMKGRGYSQAQLACEICVSQSLVSLWLKGQRPPRADVMRRIADHFQVDVEYLTNDTLSERPPPVVSVEESKVIWLMRNWTLDSNFVAQAIREKLEKDGRAGLLPTSTPQFVNEPEFGAPANQNQNAPKTPRKRQV